MPRFASLLSWPPPFSLFLSLSLSFPVFPLALPYRTLFHSNRLSFAFPWETSSPSISYSIVLLLFLSSFLFFSLLLARLLALFFLSHVRARERVYGMSLFLPRFRCAPTLKRQLTIGAIHGLLARINCRRKLLRLCRESKLSRVETNSWHTGAVSRERCLFFGATSLFTQFYLISTRCLLRY